MTQLESNFKIHLFKTILSNKSKTKNAIVFLSSFFILIWITLLIISLLYEWSNSSIIIHHKNGNIFTIEDKKHVTSTVLVSANGGTNIDYNSPWVDTGIDIKNRNNYEISASGRVCLAFHRMVDAAYTDTLPYVPWIGPNGFDHLSDLPPHTNRLKDNGPRDSLYRIAPHLPKGRLIGIITNSGCKIPKAKPDSSEIIDIGSFYNNIPKKCGRLWLCINENWLDETIKVNAEKIELKEKAQYIIDNKYWNIWFDDNVGYYVVNVIKKK